MSVWGDLREAVREKVEQHRNRSFMEAAMAAAAMVAAADGTVSFAERIALDILLESCRDLRIFEPHEAVDFFNERVADILENGEDGRKACLDCIAELSDEPDHADLVVRVALALSGADGDYSDAELIQVIAICDRLKLDPQHFAGNMASRGGLLS